MSRKRKTRSADSAVKPPTIDLEASELPQGEETVAESSADTGGEAASGAPSTGDGVEGTAVGEESEDKQAEAADEGASEEPGPTPEPAAEEATGEAAPVSARSGGRWWLAAAVIVVIAAGIGAFLYREYGAQFLPASKTTAAIEKLDGRIAALEKAQGSLAAASDSAKAATEGLSKANARLNKLSAGLDDLKARVGAGESSTADLKARLDKLARTAQQSASEIAGLQSALNAAAKAGKTNGEPGAASAMQVTALSGSVDALKKRVKTLEDGLASAGQEISGLSARLDKIASRPSAPLAGSKAAQLAAAYAAMEKRISEGKPFAAELDKLKALDPNLPGLDKLASVAGKGVVGESDLATRLDEALNQVTGSAKAKSPAGGEGWLAALKRRVFSVVKIRKVGEPDWQAAGAMAKAALARGDLDGAVAALGPASSKTPEPIAQWLAAANARRQVLDRLADLSVAVFQSVKRNAS